MITERNKGLYKLLLCSSIELKLNEAGRTNFISANEIYNARYDFQKCLDLIKCAEIGTIYKDATLFEMCKYYENRFYLVMRRQLSEVKNHHRLDSFSLDVKERLKFICRTLNLNREIGLIAAYYLCKSLPHKTEYVTDYLCLSKSEKSMMKQKSFFVC